MVNLKVRKLNIDKDVSDIVRIHRSMLSNDRLFSEDDYLNWYFSGGPWMTPILAEPYLKDQIKLGNWIFVASIDDRIVAEIEVENVDQDEPFLSLLMVDQNFTSRGVGTFILSHICKKLANYGAKRLVTYPEENAKKFYEKNGFSYKQTRYEISKVSQKEKSQFDWQPLNDIPNIYTMVLGFNQPPLHHIHQFSMTYKVLLKEHRPILKLFRLRSTDTVIGMQYKLINDDSPVWCFAWGSRPINRLIEFFDDCIVNIGKRSWFTFCNHAQQKQSGLEINSEVQWWVKELTSN